MYDDRALRDLDNQRRLAAPWAVAAPKRNGRPSLEEAGRPRVRAASETVTRPEASVFPDMARDVTNLGRAILMDRRADLPGPRVRGHRSHSLPHIGEGQQRRAAGERR